MLRVPCRSLLFCGENAGMLMCATSAVIACGCDRGAPRHGTRALSRESGRPRSFRNRRVVFLSSPGLTLILTMRHCRRNTECCTSSCSDDITRTFEPGSLLSRATCGWIRHASGPSCGARHRARCTDTSPPRTFRPTCIVYHHTLHADLYHKDHVSVIISPGIQCSHVVIVAI